MSDKNRNLADLLMNLLIVVSTVLAVGVYFFGGPDVLGSTGTGCFKYFTTDSNVLAAFAALVMSVYNLRRLKSPEAEMPKWIEVFKFTGTVSVAVTLLTVVFFLAPVASIRGGAAAYFRFFADNTFALHFSTPILAIVSFILFERDHVFSRKDALWGLTPTIVYSIVYLVLVVFVRVWTDWYGFTFGGKLYLAPLSMLVMYLATWAIGMLLLRLRGKKAA